MGAIGDAASTTLYDTDERAASTSRKKLPETHPRIEKPHMQMALGNAVAPCYDTPCILSTSLLYPLKYIPSELCDFCYAVDEKHRRGLLWRTTRNHHTCNKLHPVSQQ